MPAVADIKINQNELSRTIYQVLKDQPALPSIVMEIGQTVNDPKTSASDINKLTCMDQALSAKVLRIVNSAHFGFSTQVSTITQAIVILGFDNIRNLATAVGAANQFLPTGRHLLSRDQFWAHSVATAVASSTIAHHRGLHSKVCDEVFVGGLLHDLGKLFLDQYFTVQYNIAIQLAKAGKVSMLRAEETALGIDHAQVGKRIADCWRLPPIPTSMIALHHEPQTATHYFEYTATVHAADMIVKELGLGSSGDDFVPNLNERVATWLAFTPKAWEDVRAQTATKFEKAKELVAVLGNQSCQRPIFARRDYCRFHI